MVDLGKPKLRTKFEVASFSHCVNIEENPQISASSPSPGPWLLFLLRVILSWALANPAPLAQGHPTFFSGCDFRMGLGKPKLYIKFEVPSFSHCRNIKGKAPNFGGSPSPRPHLLFLLVRFDDGPWQTAAACQI